MPLGMAAHFPYTGRNGSGTGHKRHAIMQPKIYLSHIREEPPGLTALFYVDAHIDIYGWYLVGGQERMSAAFFMIEGFYAERAATLYRSLQDDVYAPWTIDYPMRRNPVRCPLPEAVAHELERLQSVFVDEWLFFDNDPDSASERATCRTRGLPMLAANIQCRKFSRLHRAGRQLEHSTPGFDFNILEFLEKHWKAAWLPEISETMTATQRSLGM
jgi:hypothetical protein